MTDDGRTEEQKRRDYVRGVWLRLGLVVLAFGLIGYGAFLVWRPLAYLAVGGLLLRAIEQAGRGGRAE